MYLKLLIFDTSRSICFAFKKKKKKGFSIFRIRMLQISHFNYTFLEKVVLECLYRSHIPP